MWCIQSHSSNFLLHPPKTILSFQKGNFIFQPLIFRVHTLNLHEFWISLKHSFSSKNLLKNIPKALELRTSQIKTDNFPGGLFFYRRCPKKNEEEKTRGWPCLKPGNSPPKKMGMKDFPEKNAMEGKTFPRREGEAKPMIFWNLGSLVIRILVEW